MNEFWLVLGFAVAFDFLNGFHDSANLVATVIASRALPPRVALAIAAVAEFVGPFLFGTAVAATLGEGLLAPGVITLRALLCALGAAIFWNLATWLLGLPSSSSHALVGGLVGAAAVTSGWEAIIPSGLAWILLALFLSPLLGLAVGWMTMRLLLAMLRGATPAVNAWLSTGQVFTSIALALSHSANDAQKTMGVITLALVVAGWQSDFSVPGWVVLVSAAALAAGSASGAWRLIRTLGGRVMTVRPIHGFAAQFSGAAVILAAALAGGPVSSTQVLGSALMGVGSAERVTKVRWEAGQDMLWAWLLTIPVCVLIGAGLAFLLSLF